MSPRNHRLFRLLSRAFCIGLLALPLITPPAEAAAKQRKVQAKSGHAMKKHKQASGKQTKAKKAKVHAKKAVAPKKHVAKAVRTTASPQAPRPMAKNARTPALRTVSIEPSHHATQACRREGRIYLLADCQAPLPPALLATAPTTGAIR